MLPVLAWRNSHAMQLRAMLAEMVGPPRETVKVGPGALPPGRPSPDRSSTRSTPPGPATPSRSTPTSPAIPSASSSLVSLSGAPHFDRFPKFRFLFAFGWSSQATFLPMIVGEVVR